MSESSQQEREYDIGEKDEPMGEVEEEVSDRVHRYAPKFFPICVR